MLLTLASYTARASKAIGYRPLQFVADFSFIAGLFYFIGFIYNQFFTSSPYPITSIIFMTLAGFVINLAFLFLNAAVLSGKGALAMAITQTQSFFWLILEILISLRVPYVYETIAMGFGIMGASIIAVAKK